MGNCSGSCGANRECRNGKGDESQCGKGMFCVSSSFALWMGVHFHVVFRLLANAMILRPQKEVALRKNFASKVVPHLKTAPKLVNTETEPFLSTPNWVSLVTKVVLVTHFINFSMIDTYKLTII